MTQAYRHSKATPRAPDRIVTAHPSLDGVGVKINRIAGPDLFRDLDPFLLIDEIRSDQANDYIGGFPNHPHRGFETITYLRHGKMRHGDHMGNSGLLNSGDLQWMTAGRGVIHSEMPEQDEGLFHGFQIWLNLPAKQKMVAANYHDYRLSQFPVITLGDGSYLRVLVGDYSDREQTASSPLQSPHVPIHAYEVILTPGTRWAYCFSPEETVLVYLFQGASQQLKSQQLAIYRPQRDAESQYIELVTDSATLNAIVLAGQPLREPVAQHGPFVMNTMEEIEQAINDYQNGQLTA